MDYVNNNNTDDVIKKRLNNYKSFFVSEKIALENKLIYHSLNFLIH